MKRNHFIGPKHHSWSGAWLAGVAFAGTLLLPLSAWAQFGPTPTFGAATNFGAGTVPLSVAVGHFNPGTDAFLDFAVVNQGSSDVTVMLGDGAGGFTPATGSPFTTGVGTGPSDIAVGDVNNDGILDLVTANTATDNVSVLFGNGTGVFGAATTFAAGDGPTGIAIGEVTGSVASPDIVVANSNAGTLSVLTGNGSGTFVLPLVNYTVGTTPEDIALADLNGDLRLDVVVANAGSGNLSVLLGDVGGVFTPATGSPFTTGGGSVSVAVGNLNAGTNLDVVVTNRTVVGGVGSVSVLLGNGDGTLQTAVNTTVNDPVGIALGDFNLDNKIDVAVSNLVPNTLTVLNGNGLGGLLAVATPFATGTNPVVVGMGDFNGDAKADLVLPNAGSANASVLLNTLANQADVSITKTGPLTVTAGTNATYTIVVTNNGPFNAVGVSVADTPVGMNFVSTTCTTGSFPCTLGAMTVGQQTTFQAVFSLAANSTATTVSNSVAVTTTTADPDNTNNSFGPVTSTVVRLAELTVSKTDGQTNETPGTAVSYTIVVSNAGPSTLTQLNLTDSTLPLALLTPTFTAVSGGTYNSGNGNWTGISLAPGGTVTMTLSGTIDPAATGNLVNTATVAVIAPDTETNTTDNTASDSDTLVRQADLTVTKDDGQTTETPGTAVSYLITVSNAGPSTLTQLNLTDSTLPLALLTPTFTAVSSGTYNSGNGNWTGISLAPGGTVTMTLSGTINPAATGNLVNTATVAVIAPDTETNTANNTGSDTDTLVRSAELTISNTDGQTSETPGTAVSYTITVSNAGPSTLTQVRLTDTPPAALLNPVFAPLTGVYDSGTGAWTSISLGPTGTVQMTLSGTIDPAATGTLVNTATVAVIAPDTETNTGNNTASDSDTLAQSADLAITKTGPAFVAQGQNVAYTIVVTNNGPSDAAGVSVGDTPTGVTFVSNAGDCATAFPCGLGAMTVGQTKTIQATFALAANSTATTVSNSATVTATTADPNNANNTSAPVTSTVTSSANLAITKTGPLTAGKGDTLTYTITVTNNGPADATTVEVTDATPTGLTFVSNTGDCTTDFPCTLGLVAVGATRTITATFSVPATYAGPNPIQNVATVSGATTDQDPSDNSATAATALDGLAFHTVAPCRVLDTRDSANAPALTAGPARSFAIADACGVPATAAAVSINVTVTQPTAQGNLRIYPAGTTAPLASAINYSAGQTRANNAVVKLGTTGGLEVLCDQPAGTTVHFILDVNGYFE